MPLGAPSLWLKKGRTSQNKLTRLHDGENEARTEGLWVHRSGAEKGGEELTYPTSVQRSTPSSLTFTHTLPKLCAASV